MNSADTLFEAMAAMEALRELENEARKPKTPEKPKSPEVSKSPEKVPETIEIPEESATDSQNAHVGFSDLIIDESAPGQKRKIVASPEPPQPKKSRRPRKTIVLSNPPLVSGRKKLEKFQKIIEKNPKKISKNFDQPGIRC